MKNFVILFLITTMLLTVAINTSAQTTTESTGKNFVLKFSILENENHPQGIGMVAFKEKIEELSGGQIEVQTYFSASLYTQDGAIPAMIAGDLEMTTASIPICAEYLPKMEMFGAAYITKDYDHMKAVLGTDSEIGKALYEELADVAGFVVLACQYNGARNLNLRTDKPVMKPEDLSATILRMPNAPAWIQMGESLGAKVSPLAYSEVYTALQLGTIDAQDNPHPAIKSMKFYEVTKQICLTNHSIGIGLLCVSKKTWDQMTEQQQEWMYEAADAATEAREAAIFQDEAQLIDFFKSEGLIIVKPDIEAFRKHSAAYYKEKGIMDTWDMDLYNKIQALVD